MSCLKFLSIKYIFLLFFNILIFPSVIQAANRPLLKLASERGFEGDTAPRPAAHSRFVSDSSTGSKYKSSAEVEFVRRSNKKVAVIVPLEHEAMAQIVSGISESLQGTDSELIVKNAQGDANIMSALIRQLQEQDIDIIMPIGTTASQMTMAHIKNKPIICVAADLKSLNNPNVTGVNDEIPVTEFLTKLPPLHRIAVIYSASEKVTPEIELLKTFAEEEDIDLHLLMVQTLADLPLALKSAAADVQEFVILKDHLIVSGIKGIVQEANKRLIPVIAADEGSVKGGATIAVGVREKDIGIKSGAMAKTILAGGKPSNIPYQTIDDLVLFINKNALLKQNIFSKEEISILQLPHVEF